MPNDDRESNRSQFGIRMVLAVTGGLACFAACARVLVDIGIPGMLVAYTTLPCAIGAFFGMTRTHMNKRSTLLGSLMGGGVGLIPAALFAVLGVATGQMHISVMILGPALASLCVSGLVGEMVGVVRERAAIHQTR